MKIIDIAKSYVGYMEKKTSANEESFTENAGYNNFTLFGKWYGLDGQPWCAMFLAYCANKAGCSDIVGKFAYCPSWVNWFKQKNRWYARSGYTPAVGDIIFFQQNNTACHVGIVYYVDKSYVYTIEGNASGGSNTLTPNGGSVCTKKYNLTSSYILGYGHPAYTTETTTKAVSDVQTYKNGSTEEIVYQTSACNEAVRIGSLNPYESCLCYGKVGNVYLIAYDLDGTTYKKCGFVKYAGGTSF